MKFTVNKRRVLVLKFIWIGGRHFVPFGTKVCVCVCVGGGVIHGDFIATVYPFSPLTIATSFRTSEWVVPLTAKCSRTMDFQSVGCLPRRFTLF